MIEPTDTMTGEIGTKNGIDGHTNTTPRNIIDTLNGSIGLTNIIPAITVNIFATIIASGGQNDITIAGITIHIGRIM